MAMQVNEAAGGGAAKLSKSAVSASSVSKSAASKSTASKRAESPGAETGRGFLEVFRKLPEGQLHKTSTGLLVGTIQEGSGQPLTAGMKTRVNYSGWLEDGTRFDSSVGRNPFEFTLGAGRVIKGWEEGLAGMRPGERRQLVIPAALAYGERQVGKIPPGATLIFNVEAVAVEALPLNTKGTMNVVA